MTKSRYKYDRGVIQVPKEFITYLKNIIPPGKAINRFVMEKLGFFDWKISQNLIIDDTEDNDKLAEYAKLQIIKNAYKK